MAKKKTNQPWWKNVDRDAVQEAFEESTVDANGEDEQAMGITQAVVEQLEFPFDGILLGTHYTFVDAELAADDARAVDLICEIDGQRHSVAERSVQLIEPLPEGHEFLAALLDWKSKF